LLQFGTLKDYQLQGLQWLVSLYNNNLNGILADEMGLGKTIQTIALLCYVMESKGDHGPFLVIVPLSTLSNWKIEFERWAPSVMMVPYLGKPNERKNLYDTFLATHKFNVLLTTYDYILNKNDRRKLEKIDWHYIIVDEGHRMKNKDSKFSSALATRYKSRHRLILTGTPLQNNLTELWSLLNFLLPNVFNSSENFESWFNKPFESAGVESAELEEEEKLLIINRLHQVLRPFLLRRLKTDVAKYMPDKVEIVVKCSLSAWQSVMYKHIQNKHVVSMDSRSGKIGVKGLNNTFMQLRKICNHPFLFYDDDQIHDLMKDRTDIVRAAGKFDMLDQMLPKLIAKKHKVLIFTQMTRVLDIMEDYLDWRGIKHLRLDGSTKQTDRATLLETFCDDNSDYHLFLLSTRAGGLGLNLQKADTVIIFDSDWNPQMDLQAQDRAHRIGQTKEVRVYRLITVSPVEEQILERAQYKLSLDSIIIQAGRFNKHSTDSERKNFLETVLKSGVDVGSEIKLPTPEELNRMLARSDEEFEYFQNVDAEMAVKDLAEWHEAGHDGPLPPRLMEYDEIPEFLKIDDKQSLFDDDNDDFDSLGRGRRRGKNKSEVNKIMQMENLSEKDFERLLLGELELETAEQDDEAAEDIDDEVEDAPKARESEQASSSRKSSSFDAIPMKSSSSAEAVYDMNQLVQKLEEASGHVVPIFRLPDLEGDSSFAGLFYSQIPNPICIDGIKDKCGNGSYTSLSKFKADVKRLLQNCEVWKQTVKNRSELQDHYAQFSAAADAVAKVFRMQSKLLSSKGSAPVSSTPSGTSSETISGVKRKREDDLEDGELREDGEIIEDDSPAAGLSEETLLVDMIPRRKRGRPSKGKKIF
jgi:superfamily II DNA or RNA helicase